MGAQTKGNFRPRLVSSGVGSGGGAATRGAEDEAPESLFADDCASADGRPGGFFGGRGPFATRNGVLYEWKSNHYSPLSDESVSRDAFEWLRIFPKKRTERTALAAMKSAKLGVGRMVACADEADGRSRRHIIPTTGNWIEVLFDTDEKGRVSNPRLVLAEPLPDPSAAIVHSVRVEAPGNPGDAYRPNSVPEGSMFGAFLAGSFPPSGGQETAEALMAVQEYAGYTLLSGRSDQKSHLWIGEGANGKGVLCGLIQRFHRSVGVDLSNLDGFALSNLPDATLAVVDETPKDSFNEGRLKSLLGEGRISIDRKFKDPLDVRSRAKWIVNSNQEFGIRCRNSTGGFWRRFIMIEWRHVVPECERVENLDGLIFEREARIVLDWMLIGLMRYLARGARLFEPAAAGRVKRAAMANSDIVGAWLADLGGAQSLLRPAREKCETKEDVYEAFRQHCQSNGRQPVNSHEFWTRLKKLLGKGVSEVQAKDASGKMRRWVNIAISDAVPGALTAPQETLEPATDLSETGVSGLTVFQEVYGVGGSADVAASTSAEDAARPRPPSPSDVAAVVVDWVSACGATPDPAILGALEIIRGKRAEPNGARP